MEPIDDIHESSLELFSPDKPRNASFYDFSIVREENGKKAVYSGSCFHCHQVLVELKNPYVEKTLVCCPNSILRDEDGKSLHVLKSNPCGGCATLYDIAALREVQTYKKTNPERKMKLPTMCQNHFVMGPVYTSEIRMKMLKIKDEDPLWTKFNIWRELINSDEYKAGDSEIVKAASKLDYQILTLIDEETRNQLKNHNLSIQQQKQMDSEMGGGRRKNMNTFMVGAKDTNKNTQMGACNGMLIVSGCEAENSWLCHRLHARCSITGCNNYLSLDAVHGQNKLWLYCPINTSFSRKNEVPCLSNPFVVENTLPLAYINARKIDKKVRREEFMLAVKIASMKGESSFVVDDDEVMSDAQVAKRAAIYDDSEFLSMLKKIRKD